MSAAVGKLLKDCWPRRAEDPSKFTQWITPAAPGYGAGENAKGKQGGHRCFLKGRTLS